MDFELKALTIRGRISDEKEEQEYLLRVFQAIDNGLFTVAALGIFSGSFSQPDYLYYRETQRLVKILSESE